MSPYSPTEQAAVVEQLARGDAPVCPACGARCSIIDAHPRKDVAYVRRRIVVRCPSCMKSLGLDARRLEKDRADEPC